MRRPHRRRAHGPALPRERARRRPRRRRRRSPRRAAGAAAARAVPRRRHDRLLLRNGEVGVPGPQPHRRIIGHRDPAPDRQHLPLPQGDGLPRHHPRDLRPAVARRRQRDQDPHRSRLPGRQGERAGGRQLRHRCRSPQAVRLRAVGRLRRRRRRDVRAPDRHGQRRLVQLPVLTAAGRARRHRRARQPRRRRRRLHRLRRAAPPDDRDLRRGLPRVGSRPRRPRPHGGGAQPPRRCRRDPAAPSRAAAGAARRRARRRTLAAGDAATGDRRARPCGDDGADAVGAAT